MGERDYLEQSYTVAKEGVFGVAEVYRVIMRWCKARKYNVDELEYVANKTNGESVRFVLQAKRKVSDYVRNVLEIGVKTGVLEKVKVKNKVKDSGSVSVKVAGYLEKDYEDVWAVQPVRKFVRETYDKFVIGSRMKGYMGDLERDVKGLRDEVKSYLNVQKRG